MTLFQDQNSAFKPNEQPRPKTEKELASLQAGEPELICNHCLQLGRKIPVSQCGTLQNEIRAFNELKCQNKLLREALEVIPSSKLRYLADWLDIKDKQDGRFENDEVQKDLRRMADLADNVLS